MTSPIRPKPVFFRTLAASQPAIAPMTSVTIKLSIACPPGSRRRIADGMLTTHGGITAFLGRHRWSRTMGPPNGSTHSGVIRPGLIENHRKYLRTRAAGLRDAVTRMTPSPINPHEPATGITRQHCGWDESSRIGGSDELRNASRPAVRIADHGILRTSTSLGLRGRH